ncbi:hypothetical protein AMQ83_30265 [Paenibacillus riograndensis]|nr:hypothetical protein AMQ83_30265 [Paenibacillus riograndensis]
MREEGGLAKGREHIYGRAEKASRMVSVGNQMGEGWFLTAEMMDLLDNGVNNIACIQPFACLPNHITGRGMIKGLKDLYPGANIAAIDYDAGVSVVNQANRIKLMMSIASGLTSSTPSSGAKVKRGSAIKPVVVGSVRSDL